MPFRRVAVLLLGLGIAACGDDGASPGTDGGDPAEDGGGTGDDGGGPDVDGGVAGGDGDRVFATDVLHVVEITVAEEDLDTLDNDQTVRVPCTLTVDGETLVDAGIRKKGATSMRPLSGKPGFTIKMNTFNSGNRLDGLDKLVLDNAVQDPSFSTGHLSYEVYRRAGLPAPRTSHATVRFNGEDKGIYVLEEATNGDYLRGLYGSGDGNLYEGPWDFTQGAAAADLKDEIDEGRTRDDLIAFTDVVMESSLEDFPAALEQHLDVDQFITNYAVEVVAALWDNYAYVAWNYYLYHVPDGRFVILTHGVNWPYWVADLDPFDLYAQPWGDFPPGYLCVRLRDVPAYDAQFHDEVTRVARDGWDPAVLSARLAELDATLHARTLTGASAADLAGFEDVLPEAEAFITDRRAYLEALLDF